MLKKSLVYSFIAVVFGVLAVVAPLFLVPAIDLSLGAGFASHPLTYRTESLEELYGLGKIPMQGYLAGLLTLVVGFAAAMAVYFIVKTRLFRWF